MCQVLKKAMESAQNADSLGALTFDTALCISNRLLFQAVVSV